MTEEDLSQGLIKLRLTRINQLFNSLDPSPFHERDLDADAEQHIVAWARELPTEADLRIRIEIPADEMQRAQEHGMAVAVGNYFGYRADLIERDLRELFRVGRRNLAIGLVVLTLCLLANQVLQAKVADNPLMNAFAESLIILGWVANWRPLETFLYDWWPIRRRLRLYRRLAAAPTEFIEEGRS